MEMPGCTSQRREKQNWHDQLRLKTMSMVGAGVREASTTTATRQAFAQLELRRVLVAVDLAPLVQAPCEHCNDLVPSVLLHGHASTAPSFVIDHTDLQQFFLNRGLQCAKLDPFSDDNTIISTRIQEMEILAHPGKWSDPRRDALAASIFALSCQTSPTFAKRDTTLGIDSFEIF